jgi:chromosome segregation ATPase
MERAVSPKSDSDEFDSLDLDEVGEKSLWVLRGEGKEQSLRVSRSLRTKELEALRRENKDLKKQADDREAELRQRQKQIASLTQQLEVCQPQHTTYQLLNVFRIWYGFQFLI